MTILFFAHYLTLYGANRSLLALLKGMSKKGEYTCIVVVPGEGPITESLKQLNIEYLVCNFPWWVYQKKNNSFSIEYLKKLFRWIYREYLAIKRLKKLIGERQIDLIHSNSSVIVTGFIYSFFSRKPHVWHLREFGSLDYNYYQYFGKYITSKIINHSAGLICVSNAIKQHFKVKSRITNQVIYNGVISSTKMESFNIKKKDIVKNFVILGLVSIVKGHEEAIRAFAIVLQKYPDSKLHIIGSGDLERFQNLVRELNIHNSVTFYGHINDVFSILENMDVLIMCSRNEAMGRVTAEAMCMGIPVIGYNSSGTSELISDGIDGLLYLGNYADLSIKMMQLVENPIQYLTLSKNAFEKGYKRFTEESYLGSVCGIYENIFTKK